MSAPYYYDAVDMLVKLKIPAIFPKLTETPGKTHSPGPELGKHNDEILKNLLHYNQD